MEKQIIILPIFHSRHFYVCKINLKSCEFIIADSGIINDEDIKESATAKYNILYNNVEIFIDYSNQNNKKLIKYPEI